MCENANIKVAPELGGAYAWLVWVLGVLFVILLFAMQTGYAISSPYVQMTYPANLGHFAFSNSILNSNAFGVM